LVDPPAVFYFGNEKAKLYVAVGTSASSAYIAISNNGDDWDLLDDNNLTFAKTIAYNGDMFVVGGDDIIYSYDGINYSLASSGLLTSCNKILWGDNLFIGLGAGATYSLIHSFDGVHWIGNNNLFVTSGNDIVYNNSIYLALGSGTASNNTILKSTDGLNWSEVASVFFTNASNGIWDGKQFVIIGQGTYQIVHSNDGNTFTPSSNIFSTSANCISYNGGIYIALGVGTASIAYSYDSYVWVNATTFSIDNPNSAFWDGDKFLILGDSIARSYDGILYSGENTTLFTSASSVEMNLKQRNTIRFESSMTGSVDIMHPILIGMDNSTDIKYPLLYSYDAHMWYPLASPLFTSVSSILWSGDKWVVYSNNVYYSYDLKTWTAAVGISTEVIELYCNDQIYIATSENTTYYSYDGIYWNVNETLPETLTFHSIVYNGTFFVAVGVDTSNDNSIFKSSDGINWTNSVNPLLIGNDICWTGSVFVACGQGDTDNVVTSTDGVTWVGRGLVTTLEGKCIACNLDGSMIVIGSESQLKYSVNQGVNWTSISAIFDVSNRRLSFTNNRFIATGTSTLLPKPYVFYSFDGLTWYKDYNINTLFLTDSVPCCIYKTSSSTKTLLLENNLSLTTETSAGYNNLSLVKLT
jgi:hypothetical protein